MAYAIWWHVYPLGFTDADTTGCDRQPARRLGAVADWLNYAVNLGASGIALGPIFEADTHGNDSVDYYIIDEWLGDETDFDDMVACAHERGLRVLLDGSVQPRRRWLPSACASHRRRTVVSAPRLVRA